MRDEWAETRMSATGAGLLSRLLSLALALWTTSAAAAAPPVPQGALGTGAVDHGDPRVEARLLVDAETARPGDALRLGVYFELDRGWHIYWRNPGESGLATRIDWGASDVTPGPLRWPAAEVFSEADGFITTYGYAEALLLTSSAHVPADARGEIALHAKADFLVCEVQCIPGSVTLERTLAIGAQARPADPGTRALFEEWEARLPVTADALGLEVESLFSQSAVRPGDAFLGAIAVVCADAEDCEDYTPGTRDPKAAFVPDRIEGVSLEVTGHRAHPFTRGLLITLAGQAAKDDVAESRLAGVLSLRARGGALHHIEVDLPVPRAAAGTAVTQLDNPWLEPEAASLVPAVPFWQALLLALLGGLILNLMPCVLPVLAIKVFGIAEHAHRDRREVLGNGAAYTAGILAAMAALAAVVLALRGAGTSVGWGFQFQEPIFVAAISSVLLVFALNLFGVFEISVDASALQNATESGTGTRRSFFEGLLAVVVATPCSAPFLGTAVGFAFASSAPVIVAIFLAIGLGLAAPFVAITLVPGWARLVPRSGPWMLHLRVGLGFALLATVLWLLWLTGRTAGVDGLVILLAFLLALAAVTWLYGVVQRARAGAGGFVPGLVFAGLAVIGLALLPLEGAESAPREPDPEEAGVLGFDPAAIQAQLGAGNPVFVYFTADWCLTCKLNERAVLRNARVVDEMERLGFARFKADWTRRDETIRAELARFGRAGVPMYLIYTPRSPRRPDVLPELLTVDLLVEALRRAGVDQT